MILNDTPASAVEKDLMSIPIVRWGLTLVGIAMALLAMDIMLRRPLLQELASVRRELSDVEKSLHELVGTKETAWETNHLLSALQAQKKQLDSAKSALSDVREFRFSVENEAQQLDESIASLSRIAKLHQQVIEASKDTEAATVEAQKLGDLRTKVLESSAGVEDAQKNAAELIALKDSVHKVDNVVAAQEAAKQLLALRDSLRANDDSTEDSQTHAKELLALRDDLAANVEDTQVASRHWASVRKLEADMKHAGSDIAEAIETLELLTDLGTELRGQTQMLTGLRQTLTEFAMLETTVGRAMRVLEPLAQLKNLTRLSESEVRAAARAILDQRQSKVSRQEDLPPAPPVVKLPHEDELFSDEPPAVVGERLVPLPRDVKTDDGPAAPIRTGAVE